MTARTCQTRHHGHEIRIDDAMQWRCFRIRTMRDQRGTEKGILHPGVYGSSCIVERDNIPEPHRVAGDKCGVSGVHWIARKA